MKAGNKDVQGDGRDMVKRVIKVDETIRDFTLSQLLLDLPGDRVVLLES